MNYAGYGRYFEDLTGRNTVGIPQLVGPDNRVHAYSEVGSYERKQVSGLDYVFHDLITPEPAGLYIVCAGRCVGKKGILVDRRRGVSGFRFRSSLAESVRA